MRSGRFRGHRHAGGDIIIGRCLGQYDHYNSPSRLLLAKRVCVSIEFHMVVELEERKLLTLQPETSPCAPAIGMPATAPMFRLEFKL